jgi:hypothetical protein
MQMCTIDDGQYIMCNFDDQIFNAALIDHLPIKIKSKYIFACSPIGRNNSFVSTRLVNFAKAYSVNESVTIEFLKHNLKWSSLGVPENIDSIVHLENVYDVLDLYLWLGFRFPAIFSYSEQVKEMRVELEFFIEKGVEKLLANKKNNSSSRKVSKSRQSSLKSVEKADTQPSKNSIGTRSDIKQKLTNLKVDDYAKFNKLIQAKNLDNVNNIQAKDVKVNVDGEMKSDDIRPNVSKDKASIEDKDLKRIQRKNSETPQNIFSKNEMHALKENLEREEANALAKRNIFEEGVASSGKDEEMVKFNKLIQAQKFSKNESSTENLSKNVFSKIDMHDLKDMTENPEGEEVNALTKRFNSIAKGDDTNVFEEELTYKSSLKKESMFKLKKSVQTKELSKQGTIKNFAKSPDNTNKIQAKDDMKVNVDGEIKSDDIRLNIFKDKDSKRIQRDNFVTKQNSFSKIDMHDLKDMKENLGEVNAVTKISNSTTKRDDTYLVEEEILKFDNEKTSTEDKDSKHITPKVNF